MSSRVISQLIRVSLASQSILFSSGLHVEVNTSHNYHNINMMWYYSKGTNKGYIGFQQSETFISKKPYEIVCISYK